MKIRIVLSVLLACLMSACSQGDTITMTANPTNEDREVSIGITGFVEISWGDGAKEKHASTSLTDEIHHTYAEPGEYKIKIAVITPITLEETGEQLVEFDCSSNHLSSLDVSKIKTLKTLSCQKNSLTTLDLTGNPILTDVSCAVNELTQLDVTKNPELKYLLCHDNKLAKLDVSKNKSLFILFCHDNKLTGLSTHPEGEIGTVECWNNEMDAAALNSLFKSLPNRSEGEFGAFRYDNNPGAGSCDESIFQAKNWVIVQ